MLIDTHAHLADKRLSKNLEKVIKSAKSNGVEKIISVGCSISEAETSLSIAKKHSNVYATTGLYPFDSKDETNIPLKERLQKVDKLAVDEKIVAIGECGIDLSDPPHWEVKRGLKNQEDLFRSQIEIARKHNKPVIIHSRRSIKHTLKILKEEMNKNPFKSVWHCFSEKWDTAEKVLDLGLMFSFTGIITYPNAKGILEVIRNLPEDRIMIETDAPYLVPNTFRDDGIKLNEPQYVTAIAKKIAEIKSCSFEEIAKTTSQNANNLFKI